ncbi:hypothetical protein D3C78_1257010 [compost metagenome]
MLAVVLVLQYRLDLAQTLGKLLAGSRAFIGTSIGVATPVQVDLGQIIAALPQAPVDGALHACAIRPGLGAEDAPTGLPRSIRCRQPRCHQGFTLGAHLGCQRIHVVGLIQRGHRLHGGVEQPDQVGEGIAEEPGHPQGHIHPWPVQQAQGQYFEIVDPLAAGGPHRAYAHQRHRLGDIIAPGAHGRRAPD